jgi:hypothetical protein
MRKSQAGKNKEAKDEKHFEKFRVSNIEAMRSVTLVPSFRMFNVCDSYIVLHVSSLSNINLQIDVRNTKAVKTAMDLLAHIKVQAIIMDPPGEIFEIYYRWPFIFVYRQYSERRRQEDYS